MDTKLKLKAIRNFAVKHVLICMVILIALYYGATLIMNEMYYYNRGPYSSQAYCNAMQGAESYYDQVYPINMAIYKSTDYLKTIQESDVKRISLPISSGDLFKGKRYLIYDNKTGQIVTNSEEALTGVDTSGGTFSVISFVEKDAYKSRYQSCNLSDSFADQQDREYDDNGYPKKETENKHSKYIKNASNYELFIWIPKEETMSGGVYQDISLEEARYKSEADKYLVALWIVGIMAALIVLWMFIGERRVLKEYIQRLYIYKLLIYLLKWVKSVFFELFTRRGIAFKVIIVALMVIIGVFLSVVFGYGWSGNLLVILFIVAILCLVYMINLSMDLKKIEDYTSDSSSAEFKGKVRSYNLKLLAKNIEDIKMGYSDAVNDRIKNERLKAELVTNISHDLKTPLTSIINYTDILLNKDITDSEREDYIRVLNNKGHKLKKLIDDLFEISKITSGKAQINLSRVNVVELISQTLGELSTNIESSGIEFIVNSDSHNIELSLDGNKVSRVFENLVTNIIKYSLNGTRAYIDITQEDDRVSIYFKNISKEKILISQGEFFERFSRGDKARNSSVEGNGLGLSIAKSIVDAHGGIIDILVDGDLFKVIVTFTK
ncbi:MAG: HAMP domain-containing sensor histidine kinase [Clostridium sp.]